MTDMHYIVAFIVRKDTQVIDGVQSEHKLVMQHILDAPSKESAIGMAMVKTLNAYQGYGIYSMLTTVIECESGPGPGRIEVRRSDLGQVVRLAEDALSKPLIAADIDAPVAADALSRIKQTLELDEGSMPEPDGMHDGG